MYYWFSSFSFFLFSSFIFLCLTSYFMHYCFLLLFISLIFFQCQVSLRITGFLHFLSSFFNFFPNAFLRLSFSPFPHILHPPPNLVHTGSPNFAIHPSKVLLYLHFPINILPSTQPTHPFPSLSLVLST